METKPKAGGNFNAVAPIYDLLAFLVFGRKLQQAQLTWLNRIPTGATVLLVGGGTGWLLQQVLTRCKPKRVVYLEASAQMLARASRRMVRLSVMGSVEFRLGDETSLTDEERFDVILTPFVLDLFSESFLQDSFVPRLYSVLKPGGLWLVTDFVPTTVGWQRALLWIMIRFFRLTAGIQTRQLANWQRVLAVANLSAREQGYHLKGMVATDVWVR
ncbi:MULTISPECIES: class I SAM-dependent methyltransferase [unclassified Spirosoma]|uniref:class I SAM-dependent methyltransferase n=1 Tax=unclassified Spirosoma TaxID=2621999 RepID=UPI000963E6C7|nr:MULTISPECIES: class I SAM-dependent methyltransferase [unclassified Spirosoma]MBN8821552.1 class I SAM-dependent methyltransferase [Spirosoma sp.]OJW78329.1 MAG: methyltransferase type 12 [Spirosoma sp. 48-14]